MIGILIAKFRLLIRKPWAFIILTATCMMFAFFIGKENVGGITIPVYSTLEQEEVTEFVDKLNVSDFFVFKSVSKKEAEELVRTGSTEAAVELLNASYSLTVSANSSNIPLLKNHIESVYQKMLQSSNILSSLAPGERETAMKIFQEAETNPLFELQLSNFRNDSSKIYDNQLHGLFGFTLFFVVYTIANGVINILEEKQDRIWDRLILSSVRKWEMYAGNLIFSFLMGYFQVVLIFITFRYGVGIDFHGGFGKSLVILIPYVLAIVALSILIAALSKSIRQFNALIPLISVSMSMIGGAYWPLEIVTSKLMLLLAKITPIYYGMEALNGATIYSYSYATLLQPISIMLLMAVVMMGIGIHAMEKRDM